MTATARSYHHGDLPAALLDALDGLVRERGAGAVTLREVARRADVSHAAPAHHFGDKAGLLTAYATEGFVMFRDRLAAAGARAGAAGEPVLQATGVAYVRFAVEEPGRFAVMFNPTELHVDAPEYQQAHEAAFGVLLDAVSALRTDLPPDDPELLRAATGAWSIVHGFATLWLDGNLPAEITAAPADEAAAAALTAFGATLLVAIGAG